MIRRLERADYDQVLDLLEQFSSQTGLFDNGEKDYDNVRRLLLRCEKTGHSFIAQSGSRIVGVILSIPVPDLWYPKIVRLREIAWFVIPEFRLQGWGELLYQAYTEAAEQDRRQGRITGYTMTKLANSPKINYMGFRAVETTYLAGA
jgi:predicted N-acetyltransferase YhbS